MKRNLKEPSVSIKIKRAKILAKLNKEKFEAFQRLNVGRSSQALFITNREGDYQESIIDNQLPVFVETKSDLNGQLRDIKILEYKNDKLFGKII